MGFPLQSVGDQWKEAEVGVIHTRGVIEAFNTSLRWKRTFSFSLCCFAEQGSAFLVLILQSLYWSRWPAVGMLLVSPVRAGEQAQSKWDGCVLSHTARGGRQKLCIAFLRPGPMHKWPLALSSALKIAEWRDIFCRLRAVLMDSWWMFFYVDLRFRNGKKAGGNLTPGMCYSAPNLTSKYTGQIVGVCWPVCMWDGGGVTSLKLFILTPDPRGLSRRDRAASVNHGQMSPKLTQIKGSISKQEFMEKS